jgi:hypothetical protein
MRHGKRLSSTLRLDSSELAEVRPEGSAPKVHPKRTGEGERVGRDTGAIRGTESVSAFAERFDRGQSGESQGRVGRAQNCH